MFIDFTSLHKAKWNTYIAEHMQQFMMQFNICSVKRGGKSEKFTSPHLSFRDKCSLARICGLFPLTVIMSDSVYTLLFVLTHWSRVTHICVGKLTNIDSDNGLSPERRQAIIWTNAGILLIGPLGTNFSENLFEIITFSFTKMRLKVSSAKWRPFCLGLNVLIDFMRDKLHKSNPVCINRWWTLTSRHISKQWVYSLQSVSILILSIC